jgi:hypothetical protein
LPIEHGNEPTAVLAKDAVHQRRNAAGRPGGTSVVITATRGTPYRGLKRSLQRIKESDPDLVDPEGEVKRWKKRFCTAKSWPVDAEEGAGSGRCTRAAQAAAR